jgi:hypothetical protein
LAHEKILISEYISDAVKYIFDYYPWPELTITERRFYRDQYDSTKAYQNGDEVYSEGKYWRLHDASKNETEVATLTGVSSIEYNIDGTNNDVTSIVVNINGVSERYSVVPSDYTSTNFGNIAAEYENTSMQAFSFNITNGKITGGQMIDYTNGNTSNHFQYTYTQVTSPSQIPAAWYEIGDNYGDPDWSESGLYSEGARVKHDGLSYICISNLSSSAAGTTFVNYQYDNIDVYNTNFWQEIDPTFERYIPYESEGKNTIGTILSIFLDDPRYSDTTPLNFREGREGIYIEGGDTKQNWIWVKYRIDAPSFTETSSSEEIPNFLAPAIKSYAYRGWLIGEGQHEKAMLQDQKALELLVREVDKLNSQQDRGRPYSISSEPYRRLNSRGGIFVESTEDQIGSLKSGSATGRMRLSVRPPQAGNATKRGFPLTAKTKITTIVKGLTPVKLMGTRPINISLFSDCFGRKRMVYDGFPSAYMAMTTGKAHRATRIGSVRAQKAPVMVARISLKSNPVDRRRVRSRDANSELGLSIVSEGGQFARYGSANGSMSASATISGGQFARYAFTSSSVEMGALASGGQFIREATLPQVDMSMSANVTARMAVDYAEATSTMFAVTTAAGAELVLVPATASATLTLESEVAVVSWEVGTDWADVDTKWENAA